MQGNPFCADRQVCGRRSVTAAFDEWMANAQRPRALGFADCPRVADQGERTAQPRPLDSSALNLRLRASAGSM
jgi:hypothetical protein